MSGIVAQCIAKWNGTSWGSLGAGNYLQHKVTDICEYNNKLFVAAGELKSWDGSQWSNYTFFDVSMNTNITVTAKELHLFNGEMYILAQNSDLLKYDGANFINLQIPNSLGNPYCIEDFNGDLYLGTNSGVYK